MGTDLIKKKFDDVDEKVDFLIELCQALQKENEALLIKIKRIEEDAETKKEVEEQFSEQEAYIQSKIDGLLKKLDLFSNSHSGIS